MFYLVSYDIISNKRRAKVANTLKDFGDRVQRSVFECILDRKNYIKMMSFLKKLIDLKKDSVRVYQLCEGCKKCIKILGLGELTQDEEVYIV